MPEESAVQYVAKLKAKLVANRKIRMAAEKLTVTKVVMKSQQVGHVKLPPKVAGFIGPRDAKYVEDMKKTDEVKEAEEAKVTDIGKDN